MNPRAASAPTRPRRTAPAPGTVPSRRSRHRRATAIASPSPAGPPIGSAQSSRPRDVPARDERAPDRRIDRHRRAVHVVSERRHAVDVAGDRDGAGRVVRDAVALPRHAAAREARPRERAVAVQPRREDRPVRRPARASRRLRRGPNTAPSTIAPVSAIDVAPLASVPAATPRAMSSPGPPARFDPADAAVARQPRDERVQPARARRRAIGESSRLLSSTSVPSNQPATATSSSPSAASPRRRPWPPSAPSTWHPDQPLVAAVARDEARAPRVPSRTVSDANATLPGERPGDDRAAVVGRDDRLHRRRSRPTLATAATRSGCPSRRRPAARPRPGRVADIASPACAGVRRRHRVPGAAGYGKRPLRCTPSGRLTQAATNQAAPGRIPQEYPGLLAVVLDARSRRSGPLLVAVADRPAAIINSAELDASARALRPGGGARRSVRAAEPGRLRARLRAARGERHARDPDHPHRRAGRPLRRTGRRPPVRVHGGDRRRIRIVGRHRERRDASSTRWRRRSRRAQARS